LIGDMAYGSAELLGWMVNDKAIEPHVPLWDRTQRTDDTISSNATNTSVRGHITPNCETLIAGAAIRTPKSRK